MVASHAELDGQAAALAARWRLAAFHIPDSRRMARGLPDWILIGPRGVLWREVKAGSDRLSHDQRVIGYLLQAAGQDFAVWDETAFITGAVEADMRRIAAAPPRGNVSAGLYNGGASPSGGS